MHYRLVEQIGEGGMGVVWRATDTSLGRDVAIKVLPAAFSGDPERLVRFEREAKLLASLSHPNIAAVYGLHVAEGVRFLAMELVKGEDLATRIARGPLPVEESLTVARQIAEGLEAAHENGVIHRDLKPANIRLATDGTVKILDFGLAKAFDLAPASGQSQSGLSPTVTSAGTVMGLILGTAAYMSPEQARGQLVDRRTDIWSFGCVLYEMLTGARPFDGETVSDSIAKILQTEVDLARLPAKTPGAARTLIVRCLEKSARRRLRDVGDARLVLEEILSGKTEEKTLASPARPAKTGNTWIPWAVAALAIAAAVAAIAFAPRGNSAAGTAQGPKFVALNAPEGLRFTDQPANAAVSPDGSAIAVAAVTDEGIGHLFVRRFDDPLWRSLPGTERAQFPFWSPDGRHIGFFASNKLKKIAIGGGTADTICSAPVPRGGTWNQDGLILFTPGSAGPIMQVRAEGGEVTPATELDAARGEVNHRFPRFLPDGKHFFYGTIPAREGGHESWLGSLGSKERTLVVLSDGVPSFAPPDRLIYRRNKTLFVQTFDPAAGRLSGEPRALVEANLPVGFMSSPTSSTAGDSVMAFVPLVDLKSTLVWFGLDGVQGETLPLPPGQFADVRISPDGTRAAASRNESDNPLTAGSDIWLVDLARKSGSRVTFDPQFEFSPVWSPDGRAIYFNSNKTGAYLIYKLPVDGAGDAVAISKPQGLMQTPDDITPDGRQIIYEPNEPKTGNDIAILDTAGDKPPVPYLNGPASETQARLAPDGRWIAYVSAESGHDELYVQSFPTPGSKIQVSNAGAREPAWSRDGKRLLYIAPDDSLMAADVTLGAAMRISDARPLFRFPRKVFTFDLAPDGKRLLATMATSDSAGRSLGVIFDWDTQVRPKP